MSKFDDTQPTKQKIHDDKNCSFPGCSKLGTISPSPKPGGSWYCTEHYRKSYKQRTPDKSVDGMKRIKELLKMTVGEYTDVPF